ncbi:MAG: hypothetical protein BroJett040_07720 [Oligoflexia bacterium]|nr:MAG: hypothetical protein BroJett040_07720 [Oligoflexia bacterium]
MIVFVISLALGLSSHAATQKSAEELYEVAYSSSGTMPERWSAMTLAIQTDKEVSEKEMQKALTHPEWFVRNAALVGLKESHPELAERAAFRLLSDKAMVVRVAAINALPNDLSTSKRELLWAELYQKYNFRKKQSLWVRGHIIEKLAQAPQKREYPNFTQSLSDSDDRVVNAAVEGLEKLLNRKMGSAAATLKEKKNLWLAWTRKNPNL